MGANLGVWISSIAFGDIDNDGDLDIALTGKDNGLNPRFIIFQNDGGVFNQVQEPIGANLGVRESSIAYGDIDNDGDLDIALTGWDNGGNNRFIIFQNDAGTFNQVQEPMGVNQGVYDSSIAFGDIDNDGDLDIALTGRDNGGNQRFIIFQNNEATVNNPPVVPAGMSSTNVGGYWRLSWNQSSDDHTLTDVLRYQIAIGTNSGIYDYASTNIDYPRGQANLGKVTIVTGAKPYYQTSIPSSNTIYWKVCAIDSAFKHSAYSSEQVAVPLQPPAPIGLIATAISSTQINLTWNDVPNETSYTLFRNTISNSSGATSIAGLPADQVSYNDTGLNSGTTYYYWVKAYNANGASGFSVVASNKTLYLPNAPTAGFVPASGVVLENTDLKVLFDWADGTDVEDLATNLHYILRIDDDGEIVNNYYIELVTTNGICYFSNVSLSNNKHYFWAVKTVDTDGGESVWSELQDFYIITTKVNAPVWKEVKIEGMDAYLSWILSTEPQLAGYRFYWGNRKGSYTGNKDVGMKSQYILKNLNYDAHYYITLAGYDIAGREGEKAKEKQVTIRDFVGNEKCILFNTIVKPLEGEQMELMIKLEKAGEVQIKIYSQSGRFIKSWKEYYHPGIHTKTWNVWKNDRYIGAGVYYIVVKTKKWSKKLLLCVVK